VTDDFLQETGGRGAVMVCKKVGDNEWDVFGRLAPDLDTD